MAPRSAMKNTRFYREKNLRKTKIVQNMTKTLRIASFLKNLRIFHLCSPTERDSTHVAVADIKKTVRGKGKGRHTACKSNNFCRRCHNFMFFLQYK